MKLKIFIFISLFSFSPALNSQEINVENKYDRSEIIASEQRRAAILLRDIPEPTPNQLKYNVTYYDLRFFVNFGLSQITASSIIKARALENLQTIELDFSTAMIIDNITVNGVNNSNYTHTGNLISINLDQTINSNEWFTIVVGYHGNPSTTGFGSFEWSSKDGFPVFWTLSEPYGAKDWWPCKNTPTDKADSIDIRVTVPAGYKVASNGLVKSVLSVGDSLLYHWKHQFPIATYLVAIAGAPYVEINDTYASESGWQMPLQHYVYTSSDNQTTRSQLNLLKEMFDAFNHNFGDYPFKEEKYGIGQFGWGGGMEHQTMTYQGSFSTNLSAHELGHQWFGDNVTCADFHHIWLNEGFASYTEAIYQEWRNGRDGYLDYMFNAFYSVAINSTRTIYVANPSEDNIWEIFNSTVYDKGAWVVHMLRGAIANDTQFFDLLKAWNSTDGFADSSATTEDLSDFVSDFTGVDYIWFFEDWIYQNWHPEYSIRWTPEPSGKTTVTISQVQGDDLGFYRMPVDLFFSNGNRDTTIRVFNEVNDEIFILNLDFQANLLDIDRDDHILKEVRGIFLDDDVDPIPDDFELMGNFPNPFNPGTHVEYVAPAPGNAFLTIYNELGQKVRSIAGSFPSSGTHSLYWDGLNNRGNTAPTGTYFYRLRLESQPSTRISFSGKMVLIR